MGKKYWFLILLWIVQVNAVSGQQYLFPAIDLKKPVDLPAGTDHVNWPGAGIATQGLGFFCRQEIRADRKLIVPVRLRLGSMQMTDWLERKPNAVKP